ncbi:MAG: phosphoribosylaminoimidazolesuccinocarboxamide synthase [Leptonema sp. (in: bacteria)]
MKPIYQGKVRDLYSVDTETFLIVSTNRISAFDVVFNEEIPNKGKTLNSISSMWFLYLKNKNSRIFPGFSLEKRLNFKDHFITNDYKRFPEPYSKEEFKENSMLVYKTQKIPFECIVRGYLAGSAWKEYKETSKISDIPLPKGLELGSPLPEILFTPSTKEEKGIHDKNISFKEMENQIGKDLAYRLKEISVEIYKEASLIFEEIGFILCDTKFEFGLRENQIYLIDEVLTPDSSRLWKKKDYRIGSNLPSYDKQLIRDYLESIQWNKQPPPPPLPQELIQETIKRYQEIEERLKKILT